MGRAADIDDLERMLNDGDGDDVLNARAIEIFERLNEQVKKALNRQLADKELDDLREELKDFGQTLQQIRKRRHANVLDRFMKRLQDFKHVKH